MLKNRREMRGNATGRKITREERERERGNQCKALRRAQCNGSVRAVDLWGKQSVKCGINSPLPTPVCCLPLWTHFRSFIELPLTTPLKAKQTSPMSSFSVYKLISIANFIISGRKIFPVYSETICKWIFEGVRLRSHIHHCVRVHKPCDFVYRNEVFY